MNAVTAALATIVNRPTADLQVLEAAHQAARDFHEAMADAIALEREVEDMKRTARDPVMVKHGFAWSLADIEAEQLRYADALVRASMALSKMPEPWRAIMGAELPKQPAAPAAAGK